MDDTTPQMPRAGYVIVPAYAGGRTDQTPIWAKVVLGTHELVLTGPRSAYRFASGGGALMATARPLRRLRRRPVVSRQPNRLWGAIKSALGAPEGREQAAPRRVGWSPSARTP